MSTLHPEGPSTFLNGVQLLFFDISEPLVLAWDRAFSFYVPERLKKQISTLTSALSELPAEHAKFDCIVSPANSYGRLDGSFDFYLSEALAPPDDFGAPTRHAQAALYKRWRGFSPPGTCTLVPLHGTDCAANPHGCNYIALCPTMRTPEVVSWDVEVVYECMWSLLVAIDEHNSTASALSQPKIGKVIIPGLATGVGGVSVEKCAVQMALAIKHYDEAILNPEKWSGLEWSDIYISASEVEQSRVL